MRETNIKMKGIGRGREETSIRPQRYRVPRVYKIGGVQRLDGIYSAGYT